MISKIVHMLLFAGLILIGMGCTKTEPTLYKITRSSTLPGSPMATMTRTPTARPLKVVIVRTATTEPQPTPTFTPIPSATPTCDALLEISKAQRGSAQYEQAIQNLETLVINPNCQDNLQSILGLKAETYLAWAQKLASENQPDQAYKKSVLALESAAADDLQTQARDLITDLSSQLANKALAEEKWDESISYFEQALTQEALRYAGTPVSVTNNIAAMTGLTDPDQAPVKISLYKDTPLTALGEYLDAQGETWVLIYAPVFESGLGIIATDKVSRDASQPLATSFQPDTLPSLQGYSVLSGITKAYQGKIHALEQDEDFPKVVAAYNAIAGNPWLQTHFPQLDKLKLQALQNSYTKGMTLLEQQQAEEAEKYLLPVINEANDPALVNKAKSALRILYTQQIDSALSSLKERIKHNSYELCDPDFERPPLMGSALLAERQKVAGWDFKSSPDLQASSLDEARFLVCRIERHRTVQKAFYTSGYGGEPFLLSRSQREVAIRIIDLLTGKQIAQQSRVGPMPRQFQKFEHGDVLGDFPDLSGIEEWISSRLPRQNRGKMQDWFNLAKEAVQAGQFNLAITSLNAFLNLDPLNDQAYWERGKVYLGQSEWTLASADLEKVVELSADKKTREAAENIIHQIAQKKGVVKCWGLIGNISDGAQTNEFIPVEVEVLNDGVLSLLARQYQICALTIGGWTKCLGDDGIDPISNSFASIAGGDAHTCGLTQQGGVKCWGYAESNPVDVIGLTSGVTALAAGGNHTCALTENGGVKCWGENGSGQLGDGTTEIRSSPVDVIGLSGGVKAIASSSNRTCALTQDGGVKCWGRNYFGQIGDGTNEDRNRPVDVIGLSTGVKAIAVGTSHTCALTSCGGVKCWGINDSGQLGDGTNDDRNIPVDVVGLDSGVTTIAAGKNHTCALIADGGVKCWGNNAFDGPLGDGTTENRSSPVDVVGLNEGVLSIAVSSQGACALIEPSK
jgi:hypothetical protein